MFDGNLNGEYAVPPPNPSNAPYTSNILLTLPVILPAPNSVLACPSTYPPPPAEPPALPPAPCVLISGPSHPEPVTGPPLPPPLDNCTVVPSP